MIRESDLERVQNNLSRQILIDLLAWENELENDITDNIVLETLDTVASIVIENDYLS